MTIRHFRKVLIANRGEIARRIMTSCHAMGLATVAVCSEADQDAPYTREADETVLLPGSRPAETYLNMDAIVEAASRTGADAIHPGYGFLAENAEFARRCEQSGICFIGPSADAIASMGSKIEAKRLMEQANVPVLPSINVGDQTPGNLEAQLTGLDWPLLIKASAGGGGRGMRIVHTEDELENALTTARQEAESAFGDGTLFIEPYIESSRHIEVQIFGDQTGEVIHLFERECSIQRRHQKIIEEAPSAAIDADLRTAICEAAVRAGKQIGYTNAGTVEFLLTDSGKFWFLEVNTRLQVEHPVTEGITGQDLVRLQLMVAQGHPLPPDAALTDMSGHAIEVRLYAEDPVQDYLPTAGTLHRFRIPAAAGAGVWVDSGIAETAEVSPFYDPMLAKVIAHAGSRAEAASLLARTLENSEIHGLQTNRELLIGILRHPEFLAGNFDTHFLQRHDVAGLCGEPNDALEQQHAIAAVLSGQLSRRRLATALRHVPSGWRNSASAAQQVTLSGRQGDLRVQYQNQRNGIQVRVNEENWQDVTVPADSPDDAITLSLNGVRRRFSVHQVADTWYVDCSQGASALQEQPRFPSVNAAAAAGSLTAPLPGVIHEVHTAVGDQVRDGDVLIVIESMKFMHQVLAPVSGTLNQLLVDAGQQVAAGTTLAVIEEPETAKS